MEEQPHPQKETGDTSPEKPVKQSPVSQPGRIDPFTAMSEFRRDHPVVTVVPGSKGGGQKNA